MWSTIYRLTTIIIGAGILLPLVGCIGPTNVNMEREQYNDAIAVTSRQQLLLNIIRVANHESAQFVDVSQVVNQAQFNGSITASAMMPQVIGTVGSTVAHTGHDYGTGFTIGGTDQPSVTYTPVLGAALVTQISQPISVDSLAALYDSEWPIEPLLMFTASRFSDNPSKLEDLVDDLQYLSNRRLLILAPTKSIATSGTRDDTLSVYVNTTALDDECRKKWNAFKAAFAGTNITPQSLGVFPPLHKIVGTTDPTEYSVELRTAPASQPSLLPQQQVLPQLRTRSALGVLMWITQADYVTFLSEDNYSTKWKVKSDQHNYAVEAIPPATRPSTYSNALEISLYSGIQYLSTDEKRHFIGIFKGCPPIGGAYVSVTYRGEHYYIRKNDEISQRNFELVGQLISMQSVTPSAPPPAPTISVGGF